MEAKIDQNNKAKMIKTDLYMSTVWYFEKLEAKAYQNKPIHSVDSKMVASNDIFIPLANYIKYTVFLY